MGFYEVEDAEERRRLLGPWADDPNILLYRRDWRSEAYYASARSRPGGPAKCIDDPYVREHNYRHMTGPDLNDVGGYVVLQKCDWSDKPTKERTCNEFGPLKCRYCGDVYDVDAGLARQEVAA